MKLGRWWVLTGLALVVGCTWVLGCGNRTTLQEDFQKQAQMYAGGGELPYRINFAPEETLAQADTPTVSAQPSDTESTEEALPQKISGPRLEVAPTTGRTSQSQLAVQPRQPDPSEFGVIGDSIIESLGTDPVDSETATESPWTAGSSAVLSSPETDFQHCWALATETDWDKRLLVCQSSEPYGSDVSPGTPETPDPAPVADLWEPIEEIEEETEVEEVWEPVTVPTPTEGTEPDPTAVPVEPTPVPVEPTPVPVLPTATPVPPTPVEPTAVPETEPEPEPELLETLPSEVLAQIPETVEEDVWVPLEGLPKAPPANDVSEPREITPEGTYRLGPGDAIDITVWEMPELFRNITVRPDGFISFPLIREIKAAGLTPPELEDALTERLSDFLVDPVVNVIVTSVASKSFYVFGAVGSPGVYTHYRDTSLLQAIITAGGFATTLHQGQPTPHGDLARIRVFRTNSDGSRTVITKNLANLSGPAQLAEDIPVFPEDMIYVPEKENFVYVFGEVFRPGVVPITDNSRLLEALLTSGGVLATAQQDQILVIRWHSDYSISYGIASLDCVMKGMPSANFKLQNGDIIYVPQKFIAKVAQFVQLYSNAIAPALETYLTSWDAWFVHERFSALRRNDFGVTDTNATINLANPDP